jgi:hypothetical protein
MEYSSNKDLYFLRVLQLAFNHEDVSTALKQAFAEIKMLADDPQYKNGHHNFSAFVDMIESGIQSNDALKSSLDYWIKLKDAIRILTDDFDGSEQEKEYIIEFFRDSNEFEMLKKEMTEFKVTKIPLFIEVEKDGKSLAIKNYDREQFPLIISGLTIGRHTIKLSNGRIIWEKELKDADLQWEVAFPDEQYPAAAMTSPVKSTPSILEILQIPSLKVEIFPGIEAGTMQISMVDSEDK